MIFLGLFAYLFAWFGLMFCAAILSPGKKKRGHH
jgi:hypothetical protein